MFKCRDGYGNVVGGKVVDDLAAVWMGRGGVHAKRARGHPLVIHKNKK